MHDIETNRPRLVAELNAQFAEGAKLEGAIKANLRGWVMAGEWKQTTVGEVTDRVTKGTTPTTLGGHFVEHGISFVKVESLAEDGRILPDKLAHIDAATDALLPRSRLEQDDILFTIAGTIGRASLVPKWLLPANTNQAVAIVRPKRGIIDPRFLFYVLRDQSRVKHAQTRVVQSVQANFS